VPFRVPAGVGPFVCRVPFRVSAGVDPLGCAVPFRAVPMRVGPFQGVVPFGVPAGMDPAVCAVPFQRVAVPLRVLLMPPYVAVNVPVSVSASVMRPDVPAFRSGVFASVVPGVGSTPAVSVPTVAACHPVTP
jgi:hypothetical protein